MTRRDNPTPQIGAAPRLFAPFDAILIVFLTAAAAAFIPLMRDAGGAVAVVTVGNREAARYPLSANGSYRLNGAIGPVVITVQNGGVRVASSGCSRQVCVRTGAVRLPLQQIVCVPNRLVVTVRPAATDKGAYDAVAH